MGGIVPDVPAVGATNSPAVATPAAWTFLDGRITNTLSPLSASHSTRKLMSKPSNVNSHFAVCPSDTCSPTSAVLLPDSNAVQHQSWLFVPSSDNAQMLTELESGVMGLTAVRQTGR